VSDIENWDWETADKVVTDLAAVTASHEETQELAIRPDGEKVAVIVKDEDEYRVLVNGEALDGVFERIWHLRYLPDGRLFALVMNDDEWTVAVDGVPWEETFDFVWNPIWTPDGRHIVVQTKNGMDYSVAVDGTPWESSFPSIREVAVSPDGQTVVAAVQVDRLNEADIDGFMKGVWGLCVNGELQEGKYVNVWGPIATDGGGVAAEVRLAKHAFSVVRDGVVWEERFGAVWEPSFRKGSSVLLPANLGGAWTLVEDGKPAWSNKFKQLWRQQTSPDGARIAAVVAPAFGHWTVAVDDQAWQQTWREAVLPPVFSPDGKRVAAVVKDDGAWTVAVDGEAWDARFDMVWDPVFGSAMARVAAKVEIGGKYAIAIDGKAGSKRFDQLSTPVFSADGTRLLVCGVTGGKYVRSVVPADAI